MKNKIDPFTKFPDEICDEIFSYLNVQDIKEASLVSKHWYSLIGSSKNCMKKLRLKLKNIHNNNEFFQSIVESTRMYQNLELVDYNNNIKSNTKYLRLMRDVVTKFASSLVSMKISSDLILKVDLPKLKELIFNSPCCQSLISANGLLTKAKGLESLTIDSYFLDDKSIKYVKLYLMENESLKVLRIYDSRVFHGLNSSNIKFRLDEYIPVSSYIMPFEFIKVHADSLKIAKCEFKKDNISFFLTNFSQLHTLTVKGYYCDDDPFDIPFNRTVKKIKFDIYSDNIRHNFFKQSLVILIGKVQVVEEVEIELINTQILRALLSCPMLKKVKYRKARLTQQDYDEMQLHEDIEFILN